MNVKLKDELDLLKQEVLSQSQKTRVEVPAEENPVERNVSVDIEKISQENDALKNKQLLNRPGKREAYIVFYKLNGMSNVRKVQFAFALTGRTNQIGILQKLKGKKLGRGCLMIPAMNLPNMQDFFKYWNIGISMQKIMLMD